MLPPGFRFGVATAGFQVEGGYNGPGEPANNWSWWEAEGRVEPSGIALDFWNQFARALDKAQELTCDAFRLSIEWARCEPLDGQVDEAAIDRYNAILDAVHDRGMQPLVTLHHFTHPAWLSVDFWLRPDSPERFRQWVELAVDRFSGRCRHWITVNEPNILAVQSYVLGRFPPGRRLDTARAIRALDNLLAAHVLAYEAIHQRQPQAVAGATTFALSLYELDRLLVDLLLARSRGIGRYDLKPWLAGRRAEFYDGLRGAGGAGERALRRWTKGAVPLEQAFPRTVAAVYDSPCERTLDVVPIDFSDPVASHRIRRLPEPKPWDDPPSPDGLRRGLASHAEHGLDLWVAGNGMCNAVERGISRPRQDGWARPAYLKANLAAVADAADAGHPVCGYYHRTLADDYEWGTYTPRFGVYGIDRERGVRWLDRDSMGQDSAAAFRRIVAGMREGDRSVLR
ncbi:MAG TPA: family 1 glycosylhydrolase [Acidimicrobiales bacterium]|jgi:beta-glucosidase/6-phospho-beta-glucosidase/beta-galactosidase|nr:family 1 glycosylhydrolase [Acidimicrobiales bacterium]